MDKLHYIFRKVGQGYVSVPILMQCYIGSKTMCQIAGREGSVWAVGMFLICVATTIVQFGGA